MAKRREEHAGDILVPDSDMDVPEQDQGSERANLRGCVAQLEAVRSEIRDVVAALWSEGGRDDEERWFREQVAEVQREAGELGGKELACLATAARAAERNADAIMDLLIGL
jgi:hypothetical protein